MKPERHGRRGAGQFFGGLAMLLAGIGLGAAIRDRVFIGLIATGAILMLIGLVNMMRGAVTAPKP